MNKIVLDLLETHVKNYLWQAFRQPHSLWGWGETMGKRRLDRCSPQGQPGGLWKQVPVPQSGAQSPRAIHLPVDRKHPIVYLVTLSTTLEFFNYYQLIIDNDSTFEISMSTTYVTFLLHQWNQHTRLPLSYDWLWNIFNTFDFFSGF